MILADEPTGNLDTKTGADVIDLLAGLAGQRGATVIVATHDAGLAARAPRRLAMRDGAIVGAQPAGSSRRRYPPTSRISFLSAFLGGAQPPLTRPATIETATKWKGRRR